MYTRTCVNTRTYQEGAVARLSTPTFQVSTNMQVSFYYHMNGSDTGVLNVYINSVSSSTQRDVFSKTGSQGDNWYLACVNIQGNNDTVSMTFAASHGVGCDSVFGIDHVVANEGTCPCKHLCQIIA